MSEVFFIRSESVHTEIVLPSAEAGDASNVRVATTPNSHSTMNPDSSIMANSMIIDSFQQDYSVAADRAENQNSDNPSTPNPNFPMTNLNNPSINTVEISEETTAVDMQHECHDPISMLQPKDGQTLETPVLSAHVTVADTTSGEPSGAADDGAARVQSRIEDYLATIGTIGESERQSTLHKIAKHLRRRYRLNGIHLLLWLQQINLTKCVQPLSDSAVDRIALLVDGSNTPLSALERVGGQYFHMPNLASIMIPIFNGNAELSGHVRYVLPNIPMIPLGQKTGVVGVEARDALRSKRPAKVVFVTTGVFNWIVLSDQLADSGRQNDYYCFTICAGAVEDENLHALDQLLRPALEGKTVCIIHNNTEQEVCLAQSRAAYFAQFSEVRFWELPNGQDGNPIQDLQEFLALGNTLASILDEFDAADARLVSLSNLALTLFGSKPQCTAQQGNTAFATEPTVITRENIWDFLRYDHTTIQFRGGHSLGDNFEYATAIPFDIDNTHSDNPADWVYPEDMARRLKELGLSFLMVSSRNHLRSKNGKAARPKFHVYLPLSAPLYDSDKFVRYCLWCIERFNADPQVKTKAQKIFGYGDNPNAFVDCWSEGRCIDEVLSDDELPPLEEKQKSAPSAHTALPPVLPTDMAEAEKRAIAYIATMPEAIQGCNGSVDALRVANKLYEFGLDRETAKRAFIEHYNPRCVPPWSEEEIDHKLDTAYSKPLKEAGCMLASNTDLTWQPFPLETLPHQLRYFVTEVSKTIGIDPANTAACVLSIVSGVIGRTFRIQIKPGYTELAMLWSAMIADSGFGKSPALDYAEEPIERLQIQALDKYEIDRKQYEADLERYKKGQSSKQRKKFESEGQTTIGPYTPPWGKPTEPIQQRYSVADCTTEALISVLAANPYGVCLIRDELSAFFNGLDAYRGGKAALDRQIYIEIHGGRLVQKDRKSGNRDEKYEAAKTPSVAIIGGVQSEVIRGIVRKEPEFISTGFGARFLWIYPPAEPIYWNHNIVDPTALSSYDKLIETLLSYRGRFTPNEPGCIKLTPEARDMIFAFQNRHAGELFNTPDGSVRNMLNKSGMHAARLCLNLHVVKCTAGGTDPLTLVSQETMQQAIILTEWFLHESRRVYAMLKAGDVDKEAEAILDAIEEKGWVTKAELHSLRIFRDAPKPAAKIDAKIKELKKSGQIVAEFSQNPNGGRGKEIFQFPTERDSGTIENPGENGGSTSTAKAG